MKLLTKFLQDNAWPILITVVGVIVGWTLLNERVCSLENARAAESAEVEGLEEINNEILQRLVRIETKQDVIIKEIEKSE